jgi:hypothetical protein
MTKSIDTNMLDSLHLDISTYSDIIDQPQATKPTIHVNKKQKVAKKKASQMPYNIKLGCQLRLLRIHHLLFDLFCLYDN